MSETAVREILDQFATKQTFPPISSQSDLKRRTAAPNWSMLDVQNNCAGVTKVSKESGLP